MSGQYNANNVKIAPHDAFYEAKEALCVNVKGKTAVELEEKYFLVYDSNGVMYAVWFDLDSSSTAPTVPGATLVPVDISTGDSPSVIAAALAAVTIGNFVLSQSGLFVFMVSGDIEEVVEDAVDVDTGFVIDVLTKGGNVYLGLIDGDISITPSTSQFTVTAHQTGTTELARIYQGFGASVELTLLECTKLIYDSMIKLSGGVVFKPSGGTEVAGYGTGQIGENALLKARTLRLHPVAKADADFTSDWYFWKAAPELGGITISGENPQTLPLTFNAFPDATKKEIIDIFIKGDGSQAGLNK